MSGKYYDELEVGMKFNTRWDGQSPKWTMSSFRH